MDIYINNTRTFGDYDGCRHHHDLMLANQCIAGVYDDQDRVEVPQDGDLIALYANGLGIIAYGFATSEIYSLDDERVAGHPTKICKLSDFRFLAYPIHHSEYKTSNTHTLQQVLQGRDEFYELLMARTLPEPDPSLFFQAERVG